DGLGHYLTVVHVQLEAAHATLTEQPATARGALSRARDLTHDVLGEVRRSVSVLRGGAPAPKPIVEALGKLAEECTHAGTDARLPVAGPERQLPEPSAYALYRAAQEALTNVRRHARATRARIALSFADDSRVRLRIEDDGDGADGLREGFGLLGLRERAELV